MDEEERVVKYKLLARVTAGLGIGFGLVGIFFLYYYIRLAFPEEPTRIGWWAAVSLVLAALFLLGYFIFADALRSARREALRKMESK